MQPATEVTTQGKRDKGGEGIEIRETDRANDFKELKKTSKKIKKKFAGIKKFPTFAVPNETGVRQRMLAGQINKIETMEKSSRLPEH